MSRPGDVLAAIRRRDPEQNGVPAPAAARRAFRAWAEERYGRRAWQQYQRAYALPMAA